MATEYQTNELVTHWASLIQATFPANPNNYIICNSLSRDVFHFSLDPSQSQILHSERDCLPHTTCVPPSR